MASGTIPLSEIPTLSLLYKLNKITPAASPSPRATSKFNDKISLIQTDITELRVHAIVNAANESLLGGGGVDGAIHKAAGRELVAECRTLAGCDTGSAKITKAYGRLLCVNVIHAVGPVYRRRGLSEEQGGDGSNERLLRGCYSTSLDLAAKHDLKSVAFSALSTGVYGYPSKAAAAVALHAVKDWLEADEERAAKMKRIIFCQFMDKDQEAYEELVPQLFTPFTESVDAEDETKQVEYSSAVSKPVPDTETAQVPDAEPKRVDEVLKLPDVPTKEPTLPDEPESKRQKLDETAKV
ncbi:Putative Macro domain-containing protein [Septoria linicola]|uniref:Macro domain-containing protein n=1 Tax=Septoria linicola TaxID=215465 RepID=A0A9Q9EJK7_9PEZI|nr:Putative Macro domain-containing protein [Septoria linicola]